MQSQGADTSSVEQLSWMAWRHSGHGQHVSALEHGAPDRCSICAAVSMATIPIQVFSRGVNAPLDAEGPARWRTRITDVNASTMPIGMQLPLNSVVTSGEYRDFEVYADRPTG
eukprot:jgi/Ulvmu1/6714/UM030_0047.1